MSGLRLSALQGKTQAEQFAIAARFAGVEPAILEGIWTTESQRGNPRFMRSSAGAEGHFGLMPDTRATWEQRFGHSINPNDFTQSLLTAAHTMKENLGAFKNVPDALRAYNGGWDRQRWNNPETRAYVGAVMGSLPGQGPNGPLTSEGGGGPAPQAEEIPDWRGDFNPVAEDGTWQQGSIYGLLAAGQEFAAAQEEQVRQPRVGRTNLQKQAVAVDEATGGVGIRTQSVDLTAEVATNAARATWMDGDEAYRDNTEGDQWNFGDRVVAAWEGNTLLASGIRMLDREVEPADATWLRNYSTDLEAGFAYPEVKRLREANSQADYDRIVSEIEQTRESQKIAASGGAVEQTTLALAAGFTDLPGWAVGLGVGKLAHMTGIGARAAYASGNTLRGVSYSALEGVVGNLAATGVLDLMGEQMTTGDYAMAAGSGALIGGALSLPAAAQGFSDRMVTRGTLRVEEAATRDLGFAIKAREELGLDAAPEAIATRVRELDLEDRALEIGAINAPTPDVQHIQPLGDAAWLTADPVVKTETVQRWGLGNLSEPTEMDMLAEMAARIDRFVADNPLDEKGRSTVLNRLRGSVEQRGAESAGLTMLNSDSDALVMFAQIMTEGTTGAGGRRRSGAMSLSMRERAYRGFLPGYNDQFTIWRKAEGIGPLRAGLSTRVRARFDREVVLDMNAQEFGYTRSSNPQVRAAADALADGFDRMRRDMQEIGAVGAHRLGEGDRRGYFPRALSAAKAVSLTPDETQAITRMLSDQFMDFSAAARKAAIDEGKDASQLPHMWDRAFADKTAKKYLERGVRNARGSYDVPVDLYSPEAAGMLQDTLQAAGRSKAEIDDLMGKMARGGPGFTKARLTIDLAADYAPGKKLVDLFDTDVPGMYSSYARRAAGEAALAQYGIGGRNGLKMLRQLAVHGAKDGKKATNGELDAFDQVSAEIMNTPFGESLSAGAKFMDNVRLMTGMARLGGTGFTAFGENANMIGIVGLGRATAAIPELPKMFSEIRAAATGKAVDNPVLNTIDTLGGGVLGADEYRMDNLLTTPGNEVELFGAANYTMIDRMIRAGANVHNAMSFNKGMTAASSRSLAQQVMFKAWHFAAKGGAEDKSLLSAGFSPELIAAMKADIGKGAEMKDGLLVRHTLKNTTMSPAHLDEMAQAVYRATGQGIQKGYIGEHNKWVHSGLMKLMTQFRSHPILAMEKQWARNIAVHGAYGAMGIIMGAMAFSLPIHLARVNLKMVGMSEEDRKKYVEQQLTPGAIIRSTMNYVSALGLYPDMVDGGMSLLTGWGGEGAEDLAESIGARGGTNRQLIGGVIAPGVGWLQDVYTGVSGDPQKLMRSMPGASLPYIAPILNSIGSAMDEAGEDEQ